MARLFGLLVLGFFLFFTSGLAGASDYGRCAEQMWSENEESVDWEKVGETRLRVMLFRIYDAQLYSDTGDYSDAQALALRINYARSFSAEALLEQTREEWERMGFDIDAEKEAWLQELQAIWPDVERGDCIVAHTLGNGITYFHGEGGLLGSVESELFAERFLGIWLAENARFRRNRDELIGAASE